MGEYWAATVRRGVGFPAVTPRQDDGFAFPPCTPIPVTAFGLQCQLSQVAPCGPAPPDLICRGPTRTDSNVVCSRRRYCARQHEIGGVLATLRRCCKYQPVSLTMAEYPPTTVFSHRNKYPLSTLPILFVCGRYFSGGALRPTFGGLFMVGGYEK
jgi:hypothetical protein